MALTARPFDSYDAYVSAQGEKARRKGAVLLAALPQQVRGFRKVFQAAQKHLRPGPVLCLGARTGAEAIAANEVGLVGSVGIDLHPIGPKVIRGDWHALPFPPAAFPNVYTNSLDHCLDLDRLTAEMRRVLTSDGRAYVMASDKGEKTTAAAVADWLANATSTEALHWPHADELRDALVARGFRQVTTWRDGVWSHYVLEPIR